MNVISRIIINDLIGSNLVLGRFKVKLYRLCGLDVNGKIEHKVFFDSKNIKIGKEGLVNNFVKFNVGGGKDSGIEVGDRVWIGMNTNICCVSHEIGTSKKRASNNTYKKITIKDGSWIGANCFIGQGVTIGEGCIIGAGAVVLKDCEPNCLYAGVPAKKIKELS